MFTTLCCPDLVLETSLLPIVVLEGTGSVEAGVELALGLDMGKLAIWRCAPCAIAAQRHVWVLEGAARVLAVGEELALLLALVGEFLSWRGVATNTFSVLACGSKATHIVDIDGYTRRCSRRLVGEFAVFVGAFEVEPANGFFGVGRLFVSHIHIFTFVGSAISFLLVVLILVLSPVAVCSLEETLSTSASLPETASLVLVLVLAVHQLLR